MRLAFGSEIRLLARMADWSYCRRRRVLLLWIVLLVGTAGAATSQGTAHRQGAAERQERAGVPPD